MRPPPRLVLQPGVYRSASTWASNVVAELLRLSGPAALLYADSVTGIAAEVGHASQAVVKMHMPDPGLYLFAQVARIPVVVTVRDPLDCIVSMMEQFHEPFERSGGAIIRSAALMLEFVDLCQPLVLRYEDERARDTAAVARIADHIGVAASEREVTAIAKTFSHEAVTAFIDDLVVTGYFGSEPKVSQHHRETHWHPRHLGNGASGRHVEVLSAEQIATIDGATQAFRRRFGYRI